MMVYGQKPIEIREVDRSDLLDLGYRISYLIEFYEKYILINNDSQQQILDKLKMYAELLKQEKYGMLIKDTSVIYNDIQTPKPTYDTLKDFEEIIHDDSLPF